MKNNIRELVEGRGLKFSYVAKKAELSKSSFYEIMNGTSIPNLKNARRIAKVLKVPLEKVFPDDADNVE